MRSRLSRLVLPVFAIMILALVAQPIAAQVNKDSKVEIKIKRHSDPTKDRIWVGPRGVGACKKADDDCEPFVEWKIKNGSDGPNQGEYVLIEMLGSFEKSGTAFASDKCFGTASFALFPGHLSDSKTITADCPAPAIQLYQVTLCAAKDQSAGKDRANCKEIMPPVDPGVIIDRGKP